MRAIIILVVTGYFFHSQDVFSAFSVGSIHQKKCYSGQVFTAKVFKRYYLMVLSARTLHYLS
ncbi:hypothetical protein DP033_16830 [Escherichia coli]|nr:hypothetical protein [Escherichia coli]EFO2100186.1 hypothetical protein [Escherichia coli]PTN28807.1 hypothetical protein A7589_01105 [Escherichia sp. MOD1-EC6475]